MTIEYIDRRDKTNYSTDCQGQSGILYVQQPYGFEDHDFGPAKDGDVGMDLPVRIKGAQNLEHPPVIWPEGSGTINFEEGWADIPAGCCARLPSGLHVKMPDDCWMMIKPRSSTGFKLKMVTFDGTVDSGYTGHLMAVVFNPCTFFQRIMELFLRRGSPWEPARETKLEKLLSSGTIRIKDGDSLAQAVLVPKYPLKKIIKTRSLVETARGASGFGSSGRLATTEGEK